MKFKFKDLEKEKESKEPRIYTAEEYQQIERERKTVQSKKEVKETIFKPQKIDFNGKPAEVINYYIKKEHSPTIIKVMNAYEDIAGISARRSRGKTSKIDILKGLIYVSIQKLHQMEKGEIR
ncbi:MAG: hypothetical protein ACFFG0_30280 [Candidatus Thorarchaeota archaeon]